MLVFGLVARGPLGLIAIRIFLLISRPVGGAVVALRSQFSWGGKSRPLMAQFSRYLPCISAGPVLLACRGSVRRYFPLIYGLIIPSSFKAQLVGIFL
jgi:hypothetical protein